MTPQLDDVVDLAWAQFWQVTVVALGALLLVRLFGRHRPHLAYVLLLLVLAKCLTPPVWSSPVGIFSWTWSPQRTVQARVEPTASRQSITEPTENISAAEVAVRLPAAEFRTAADVPPSGGALDLRIVGLLLWASGALLFGAYVAVVWFSHGRAVRRSSEPASRELLALHEQISQRVGLRRRVRLLLSNESNGPFCFGIFRPCVVLPAQLVRPDLKPNLEPILAHEIIHIRRGDSWVACFQILAGIVWWFHPLVWWTSRRLSRERERCCDAEVVAGTGCKPDDYAQGVLEVLKFKNNPLPAFLANGIRPVEVTQERLEAIMSRRTKMHARSPWFCWLILVVGLALVLPGQPRIGGVAVGNEISQGEVEDGLSGRIYLNVTLKTQREGEAEQKIRGIISVDPASGEWEQVTDNGHSVRVSRDGQKLVFGRFVGPVNPNDPEKEIWTCNVDGSGLKKVLSRGGGPVWSPDSTLILANEGEVDEEDKWTHQA